MDRCLVQLPPFYAYDMWHIDIIFLHGYCMQDRSVQPTGCVNDKSIKNGSSLISKVIQNLDSKWSIKLNNRSKKSRKLDGHFNSAVPRVEIGRSF